MPLCLTRRSTDISLFLPDLSDKISYKDDNRHTVEEEDEAQQNEFEVESY